MKNWKAVGSETWPGCIRPWIHPANAKHLSVARSYDLPWPRPKRTQKRNAQTDDHQWWICDAVDLCWLQISLTDLKPAITTWFIPQKQNNQLLAMSLRDHTQNAKTCMLQTPKKLDDGWPESIGQSLLLLLWRHCITRQPEKGWNESQRLLFDSRAGAWNSTSSIWHGSNMKRPNINNCYRVIIFQSLNGPF